MKPTEPILVIGHRNPDMDAIASALGYAWLLNQTRPEEYAAGRCGNLNTQTAFALERFGVAPPVLITDVRSHVEDVVEILPTLNQDQSLLEACQLIARTRRPVPVLDENSTPIGLLNGAGLFATFADALSSTSVLALAKEFDRRASTAVDTTTLVLHDDDFVQDVVPQALRNEHDDFLVIDAAGHYAGLCRKSALLSPARRKVVLVDHNELQQAVPGLEEAEVMEVLDHHRLSTVPTSIPIRFQIEPVGSCSTLVSEEANDAGREFPKEIAALLLCGILSDTLIFRSPTATERDKQAALRLARMAKLASDQATDDEVMAAITELGNDLLAAGAGLGTRAVSEIVNSDIKYYDAGGSRIGIAQVEVTSFTELSERMTDLMGGLQSLVESEKLAMALLMITDVVRGNSRLLAAGLPRFVSALPYPHLDDGSMDAPKIVSRKKQLLPTVLAALSQLV
ncbi:MAG: Cobalt-dependent inorganic pyrophosphatase [Chloroflexi bacterium OLB15]|nr:MAG: Cobalt-dependent inorganic pyrophosphatase [Chloroflexi bacterium OLB15]